jgi:hypothetical protein
MPIRRYVGEGVFSSEALSAMGKAFEAAIWTLGPECDEARREEVARFIIQSAQNGGSLDVATLHRRAVAAFADPIVAVIINERGRGPAPTLGAGVTGRSGVA